MSLDPNKEADRAAAITQLRRLRISYNMPARDVGRKKWYAACVAALECAMLALGDKPENWEVK